MTGRGSDVTANIPVVGRHDSSKNTQPRPLRILLGITGGIAAYKAAVLARRLLDAKPPGAVEVQVVMTDGATRFITPLTMQALTGRMVRTALLDETAEAGMGHIELARWADTVLVAPASANFLARLAHGMADDLLSTACLATPAPIHVAPAMNQQMWAAPATQANLATLAGRGVIVHGPGSGEQACGDVGAGRMLEPEELAAALLASLDAPRSSGGSLAGRNVMVTAGPTREALDPVRYLSNLSSGRMGYAVAGAARDAGAQVTLVSGPCALETPPGVERLDVVSARDMLAAVTDHLQGIDVFIGAAAVADYRPASVEPRKIKKREGNESMSIELERNPDVLATVAGSAPRPFTVGFAAETNDVERYARAKLANKRLDMIAANQVGIPGQGFDAATNTMDVYWPGGNASIPMASKHEVAARLVALIAARLAPVDRMHAAAGFAT